MLPRALLDASYYLDGARIVPHYFGERDEPWLCALLEERARFVGRKQSELRERLREPLAVRAPRSKLRIALHVLDGLNHPEQSCEIPPKEARAAVFRAASARPAPRAEVLAFVAASLGVTIPQLESSLFADLRNERRVGALPPDVAPSQLATAANLAIAASLVRRASRARVAVTGNARAFVRHVRQLGLICEIGRGPTADGVVLEVSGPFALFRQTEVYRRALGSLLPRLTHCAEFELTAACALGPSAELSTLVVRSGDPLGNGRELERRQSELGLRFERDFQRIAGDWQALAEPAPIDCAEALIFPDFELVPRRDPSRRWLLEVVGFWTPRYVQQKLERLQRAGMERFLLCVDQKRLCADEDLPAHARVIRFKSRIDARAVLALISA